MNPLRGKLLAITLSVFAATALGGCSEDDAQTATPDNDASASDTSSGIDSAPMTTDSNNTDSVIADSVIADSTTSDSATDSRVIDSSTMDASPILACVAGTGDPVACAALTGTKKLIELTATELATLCDCWAASLGGYGTKKCTCTDEGGVTTVTSGRPSQAVCVSDFTGLKSTCAATVADLLACAGTIAKYPCDLLAPWSTAECMAFSACK